MKKKYLHVIGAKHWNSLLNKFANLNKRLQTLSSNTAQYNKLVKKLQHLFSRLEKMQYQTGIKLAGTSLALVLSAHTANAQFAAGVPITFTGEVYEEGFNTSTFADLDGDGDDDLFAGTNDGKIKIYTNNGGTYAFTGYVQLNGNPLDVGNAAAPAFVDLDGDNDLDLYVGKSDGRINVYTNNNGVFAGTGTLQINGAFVDVGLRAVPAFADIDGDNDLDMYVGESTGTIKVFTNSGGTFTPAGDLQTTNVLPLETTVGSYSAPTFQDLDGDGDLDLYVGSLGGFIVELYNNGGLFTDAGHLQSSLNQDINLGARSHPLFGDIDGDGDLDLYVSSFAGTTGIYSNEAGAFTAAGNVEATDLELKDRFTYARPALADIDLDGDLDLYVGNNTGQVSVFTNDNGVYVASENLQANGSSIDVGVNASIVFADLDEDSDLDLYAGDYYGRVIKYTNNAGVFSAAASVLAGGSAIDGQYQSHPAFADVDDDGDLDLYLGDYYGTVGFFDNNAGVFSSPVNVTHSVSANTIDVGYGSVPAFADIDGDGDIDMYVGTSTRIEVFNNDGGVFTIGGNLQADGIDISVSNAATPTFADKDGDGDLDLYIGAYNGSVTVFENMSLQVGVNEAANQNVSIYPNPAKNQLFVQLDEQVLGLDILDLSGKVVKTMANLSSNSIDVSELSQGIYVLRAQTETGVATTRFVKQ